MSSGWTTAFCSFPMSFGWHALVVILFLTISSSQGSSVTSVGGLSRSGSDMMPETILTGFVLAAKSRAEADMVLDLKTSGLAVGLGTRRRGTLSNTESWLRQSLSSHLNSQLTQFGSGWLICKPVCYNDGLRSLQRFSPCPLPRWSNYKLPWPPKAVVMHVMPYSTMGGYTIMLLLF